MDILDLLARLRMDTSEYEDGLSGAVSIASTASTKIGGLMTAGLATGTIAIMGVAGATIGATEAFCNGVAGVAAYGDHVDKLSQKMGISMTAYQEWDAVMQHCGTSIDTMKASMKTLANAAQNNSDAFAELGITQEDLANMNQEQLFEATIAGLQNVEDTTKRTYLAGKLLGRGATELGALLNMSADDTQAMRDRVHELGGVMSDEAVKDAAAFTDSLQDMTTAFDGVKRNLMSEFLPSVTTVMDGLTEVFAGNTEEGVDIVKEGMNAVADQISETLPQALEAVGSILGALGDVILENLPTILETGGEIVAQIGMGIINALPTLIESGNALIQTFIKSISENIDGVKDTAVSIITAISEGFLPLLPDIMVLGLDILVSLAEGIAESIPTLLPTIEIGRAHV